MVFLVKRMKMLSCVLSCLLAGILLIGCAGDVARSGENSARGLQATTYGDQNSAAMTVADGANDFAFQLSAALVEKSRTKNFVCSPYSVWLPLAALINATDAQHKPELLAALNVSGFSEADINDAASRMLSRLTNQGEPHNPLRIADAIFVDDDMTLNEDFAQVFRDYYQGNAMNVDFSSGATANTVNQWISENTDGLITDLVKEFDSKTAVALVNAIYFSDRWDWEFSPRATTEDVFYSPVGETQASYMLREGDEQTYYEDDRVQAMPLSYAAGGGMYIILPKDGDATGLLSSMTNEYFEEIRRGSTQMTGRLLLPRFSFESDTLDLQDALTALGVPLFDEVAVPLTGGLIEGDDPVWVSRVLQKALIEVDEEGTTAAAVTVVDALVGAAPTKPTEPFEMNCNKPFVFILYGHTYDGGDQVLFTGVVNQP
jgi:serpin B